MPGLFPGVAHHLDGGEEAEELEDFEEEENGAMRYYDEDDDEEEELREEVNTRVHQQLGSISLARDYELNDPFALHEYRQAVAANSRSLAESRTLDTLLGAPPSPIPEEQPFSASTNASPIVLTRLSVRHPSVVEAGGNSSQPVILSPPTSADTSFDSSSSNTPCSPPPSGITPDQDNIWITAGDGNLPRLQALLSAHPDPNVQDPFGYSALHAATAYSHAHIIDFLIRYGANVNITDEDGDTPLHVVEDGECCAVLLRHGGDATLRNGEGKLAIEVADAEGYEEVVNMLLVQCPTYVPKGPAGMLEEEDEAEGALRYTVQSDIEEEDEDPEDDDEEQEEYDVGDDEANSSVHSACTEEETTTSSDDTDDDPGSVVPLPHRNNSR